MRHLRSDPPPIVQRPGAPSHSPQTYAHRPARTGALHRQLNPIVALAGMSVIWLLGDALPPTAIIGRLTVDVVGYRESYVRFLKSCVVPAVVIMILGTLMVVFSAKLSFLTGL